MICFKSLDGVAIGFSRPVKLNTISWRASSTLDMGRMRNKTNLYQVLGLESENVSFSEVKKAYRSMALRYHPDICPPSKKDEYTKKFVELNRAYETLSDPTSRRKYDIDLMSEWNGFSVKSQFSRETWEVQLRELKRRSECRKKGKAGFSSTSF